MVYPVQQLLTRSYHLSGVVSRELETVSGPQYADGLLCLNDVIGDNRLVKGMIPYFVPFDFTAVIGQERYFIPGLVETSTIVFFLNGVRYAMIPVDRDVYMGSPRAENIQSLPFNYHTEREFNTNPLLGPIGGGASVYFYFKPQQAYTMQLWGKFNTPFVALNQDLELILDRFYINYLMYATTCRICHQYDYDIPDDVKEQLEQYEDEISKGSGKLDLTAQKVSTMNDKVATLNYAQANIGRGFDVG